MPGSRAAAYGGRRTEEGCVVCRVDADGREHTLDARLDLGAHSPAGFEWGYPGSGPAQTALAILADAVGDELAQALHQQFKREFLVRADQAGFRLGADEIERWVEQHRGKLDLSDWE